MAELLKPLVPDVLCLQEAVHPTFRHTALTDTDDEAERERNSDLVTLGRLLDMPFYEFGSEAKSSACGQATLSRFPIVSGETFPIGGHRLVLKVWFVIASWCAVIESPQRSSSS